jgi:hypothetical protein
MEKATPRQMFKQIGPSVITYGDPISPGEPSLDEATFGWTVLTDPTGTWHHVVFRSYIDLSGYTLEDLTVFTQGIDIQKSIPPLSAAIPGNIPTVFEFDYVTTRRITDTELTQLGTNGSPPGFIGTTLDLMEMIYGERMQYSENTQITGTYIQISGDTFGSGNPSTSDKLHWTRHYAVPAAAATSNLMIFPTNLVVQAITAEEKDLVYIERLRRSYTQQRQDP